VLDPGAVGALVEESLRSDAGIVGPKLVAYGAPEILLQVGMSSDKTGVMTPLVERGELDQEQHDRVRDVFTIPGGCTLVRAELFEALGGFDPAITFLGEDLDLCWRAHLAGARVVVVPAARVQHVEALGYRRRPDDRRRLLARHRLRTLLTCYGGLHLLRVLPQAAGISLVEAVYALVTGRFGHARDVVGAWTWNLRRVGELRRRRRRVRHVRRLSDREVRRLQVRGSARFLGFVRGEIGSDRIRASLSGVGHDLADAATSRSRRLALTTWSLLGLVLLAGSREILTDGLAAVGAFAPIDQGPVALLRDYASGWRSGGLGSEAPSPTAVGLLGLAGLPLVGAMGVLQQILVLGMLPLGVLGAWRLATPLGSDRARAVAAVAYAAVPLPYAAVAEGRWATLALYGAMPWILSRLARATGDAPWPAAAGRRGGDGPRQPAWRAVLGLGVVVALVAALVPAVVLLVPLVALALLVGAVFTGRPLGAVRALGVALGSSAVAVVLHLPWALDLLGGGGWEAVGGVSPLGVDTLALGDLLRFGTGAGTASALHWGLPAAAALPLLIGRGWRLTWAGRAWFVALAAWALAWTAGRDLLPMSLPPADLLLVPAAAAISLSVGTGMAAFERDLPGYRFGLPQAASVVVAVVLALATLPTVGATLDGRWGLPRADFHTSLSVLEAPEVEREGSFRVLWLGHPDVLPLGGHPLADDLSYGISTDGVPRLSDRWAAPPDGDHALVEEALELAAAGRTQRLGRLLAPMGIRFLVLPERAAPEREGTPRRPLPSGVPRVAEDQLDLRRIEVDPAVTVFENVDWAPVRAALPAAEGQVVVGSQSLFGAALAADLSVARPVLRERTGHLRFGGTVPDGVLYLAEASSDRWELEVGGQPVERRRAAGWANAFMVEQPGEAALRYRTSPLRWLAVAGQVLLWVVTLVLLRRRPPRPAPVPAPWPARSVA
jgi:hypothetical protein